MVDPILSPRRATKILHPSQHYSHLLLLDVHTYNHDEDETPLLL